MSLLKKIFTRDDGIRVGAPVSGKLVSIREVGDPAFREEILGNGVAIIPSGNRIVAPLDGTIGTVFPTGHAVAVSGEGVDILIHVGLDTVRLKGKHFTIHVREGQKVKKGELLLEADVGQIKAEGYDIVTPIVICNSDDFAEIRKMEPGEVVQGETILQLRR